MTRAILFANGLLPQPESARFLIRPGDRIYAADGGTRHALALGLLPSLVIGDLDSLAPDDQERLTQAGVEIRQFPRDKNETDLELAIYAAMDAGCDELCIVGALGGRLDQTLANLSLLTAPALARLAIRMDDGLEEVMFTRGRCEIHGDPGDLVSLIPWAGMVSGICTQGLRWPLQDETLFPEKTRGISNEMLVDKVVVQINSGLLLCIHRRTGKIQSWV